MGKKQHGHLLGWAMNHRTDLPTIASGNHAVPLSSKPPPAGVLKTPAPVQSAQASQPLPGAPSAAQAAPNLPHKEAKKAAKKEEKEQKKQAHQETKVGKLSKKADALAAQRQLYQKEGRKHRAQKKLHHEEKVLNKITKKEVKHDLPQTHPTTRNPYGNGHGITVPQKPATKPISRAPSGGSGSAGHQQPSHVRPHGGAVSHHVSTHSSSSSGGTSTGHHAAGKPQQGTGKKHSTPVHHHQGGLEPNNKPAKHGGASSSSSGWKPDTSLMLEKLAFAAGGAAVVPAVSVLYFGWYDKILWKALLGAALGDFVRLLIFDRPELELEIGPIWQHPIEYVASMGIAIGLTDVALIAIGYDTGVLEVLAPVLGLGPMEVVLATTGYVLWSFTEAHTVPSINAGVWTVKRLIRRCPNPKPTYLHGSGKTDKNYDYGLKYVVTRDIPEYFESEVKLIYDTVKNTVNGSAVMGLLYLPASMIGQSFRHLGRALIDVFVSLTPQQNCKHS